jgi:hypothetical protein
MGLSHPSRRIRVHFSKQGLLVLGISLFIVLMCMSTLLLRPSDVSTASTPTYGMLPTVSARDLLAQLKQVGVPIAAVRQFQPPDANWNAQEEIQFNVERGQDKGLFIVLSYGSMEEAGHDAFRATLDNKYQHSVLHRFGLKASA